MYSTTFFEYKSNFFLSNWTTYTLRTSWNGFNQNLNKLSALIELSGKNRQKRSLSAFFVNSALKYSAILSKKDKVSECFSGYKQLCVTSLEKVFYWPDAFCIAVIMSWVSDLERKKEGKIKEWKEHDIVQGETNNWNEKQNLLFYLPMLNLKYGRKFTKFQKCEFFSNIRGGSMLQQRVKRKINKY